MLAEASPRQKWKNPAQREACKKAFEYVFGFISNFFHKLIHFLPRAALSQMETASEAERNEAELEVQVEAEVGVPAAPVEVGDLVAAPGMVE